MLVSIDWISDFVQVLDIPADKLAEKFTLSVAEVESIKVTGEYLKKMSVAQVTAIEPHPDAEKLNLVSFKINSTDFRKVVCGASNVRIGMKTPFAPIGTILPGGFELTPKKIRGILSEGMLCSESELGISEDSDGIMELSSDSPVGQSLSEYFEERPDVILDIDNKSLTHRPDLWGHYGMAREFAVIFEKNLKNPFAADWQKEIENKIEKEFQSNKSLYSPVKVALEGESACLGYFGLTIQGVKVGKSPRWMERRLQAVGLRPINNIVDISNYVMAELGFPNHIFDREKIDGDKVIIKRAFKNEEFQTLDEVKRQITPLDTIIGDINKILVLGGIMGGVNSGVTEKTNAIFLEVANWKAPEIRKTSNRLGLRTDSSQRYEKSLDSQLMKRTLFRMVQLILQLHPEAKIIGPIQYQGVKIEGIKPLILKISLKRINSVLGVSLSMERVSNIFQSLGFGVKITKEEFEIVVPSYRATKDIQIDADLIEEIGRVIGYDKVIATSPLLNICPQGLESPKSLERKIMDFCVLNGKTFQLMTYPLIGETLLNKVKWPNRNQLTLINPISKEHDRMRDSLIPSFLEVCGLNSKHYNKFNIFELGRGYLPKNQEYREEKNYLGLGFFNKGRTPFLELLDFVERLLGFLKVPFEFCPANEKFKNLVIPEEWEGIHPFEFTNIRIMGKMTGGFFGVHPLMLRNFKIKGHFCIAIIDLSFGDKVIKDKTNYQPLPKFPESQFDFTVVAEEETAILNLVQIGQKTKIKEISTFGVVDIFELGERKKAVTLRAIFSDPEKTLGGEFLELAQKKLIEAFQRGGYPLRTLEKSPS
jgi:phenylalanyl-tRNA synthetase beta chain